MKFYKHGIPLTQRFNDIQNICIMKLTPDKFNYGVKPTDKHIKELINSMLFKDENSDIHNNKTTRLFLKTSVVKPAFNSNLTNDCICINDNITEEKEYIVLES